MFVMCSLVTGVLLLVASLLVHISTYERYKQMILNLLISLTEFTATLLVWGLHLNRSYFA